MEEDLLERFAARLAEGSYKGGDPDVLAEIRADLYDRIENRINARILELLPESKYPAFEALLDAEDQGRIQAYLLANIPDFQNEVARELFAFRDQYFPSLR